MANYKTTTGLYVIYDKIARDVLGPVQAHKHGAAAVRSFMEIVLHPDSRLRAYADDYALLRVGYMHTDGDDWDDTGVEIEKGYELIMTARQVLDQAAAAREIEQHQTQSA